jgi:parvulin-like peptidyl-prolyl isomerase
MKRFGTRTVVAAVSITVIAGAAFAAYKQGMFGAPPPASSSTVLAVVNQQAVTTADVEALMANGMLKPVAVENAINRALAADSARNLWPADAKAIAESAAREALSGLYVRKRLDELQRAVSDADISRYYETNVTDELYTAHVLKYYLTQDARDAAEMTEAVKQGGGALLAKLNWVNREGDHAVLPSGVPYGLYRQVKGIEQGQFLGPWRVRDGVLFIRVEERRAGKRPELAKLKDEIRQILAQQRLEGVLKDLRAQAKIELK